jgi:hypothetical protein
MNNDEVEKFEIILICSVCGKKSEPLKAPPEGIYSDINDYFIGEEGEYYGVRKIDQLDSWRLFYTYNLGNEEGKERFSCSDECFKKYTQEQHKECSCYDRGGCDGPMTVCENCEGYFCDGHTSPLGDMCPICYEKAEAEQEKEDPPPTKQEMAQRIQDEVDELEDDASQSASERMTELYNLVVRGEGT